MKSKCLIILIAVALLLGTCYLFLHTPSAQQPKGIPSLSNVAQGQVSPFATKPGTPPAPSKSLGKPITSLGAYGLSTGAAKPEKVEGYQPPHHEIPPSALRQEGGETCASATAIASLPYNATGYTCDNVDDYDEVCPYTGSTSPDVVYSYTTATTDTIDIDLYGSSYDTKVYVYQDACDNAHLWACNDDYYPDYVSAIFGLVIDGGHTYYIVVDGYGGACGDYVITVSPYVACDVVCPPGGIAEGEPTCYDEYVDSYNGGCNSNPVVFQNVNCGDTICGTSGTYLYTGLNYRDTDWFRLVITQPTTLTFKAVAEFPLQTILLNAGTENCSDYTQLDYRQVNPCDTATITMAVQPGVYWLWVGPSVFSGYPCGLEYVMIVDCEVATTGACCNDLDPYDCQILTPDDCALLPNHTFRGLGTNCGPPNPCLPGPPNDDCTGAIQVFPPDCPDVVTVSGTTVGANIDCPGVLDWNAVWYRFDLTYASNKLTIDYCPTAIPIYQIGIVLYNSCPVNCSNYILASAYQFVACPNGNTGPQMWWSGLPAGTYYLPVAVWDYSMNPFNDFSFTACVEALLPPENDNCANATPVGDVTNLAFSTEAATFDGPGSCQSAPNIWYCYTATCDGNAYVSVCGSYYDTKIAAYDGCSCPPGAYLACNDDACGGTLQSEISFPVVQGNQYLIEVGGYSTATGSGFLSISCSLPPPNDECTGAPIINTFPQTVYGTTVGASVDCPGILDWNAVWYRFDVPYACNNITVDYCPTDWSIGTIGIVLYNSCPPDCPNYIVTSGYQFVSCSNGTTNPQMWWYNLPGPASYWLPVYPFAAADFGFTVYVDSCVPCDVVCPPEGIPEGEPTCYDDYVDNYNGGCNSSPYIWQNINCNTTICGTSGTYLFTGLQYRDTDWFRVEAGDGDLTFKAVAEFPLQTILIDAGSEDCVDYTVLDYRQVNMCDTATISMYVSAGVYWLWVGPSVFTGYPCGLEYVMQVECTGFGPQISVTPSGFNPVLNPTGACSSATENLIISSIGGADLNWSIAENPSVAWLEVSPTSGTLPPGQQATLDVSIDAGGMAPGDYYTNLDITSNALKGVVTVPVHLTVELPPEMDVTPRLWVPVIPGCTTTKGLRVNNLGTGDLRFGVQVKKNPPPTGKLADVLLVDDDNSINYPGDFTDVRSYFTDALTADGYTYDVFEVTSIGGDGPDAATMANYPVVIWFTGEAWQLNQTLTPNDEANLATYLDGGGNLFLSAQDYFYDRYPSAGSFTSGQFPYDYLGVTYVSQDVWIIVNPSTGSCVGMAGSVAEGMSFDLWDPYTVKGLGSKGGFLGMDDGLYIDELVHNGTDVFQMTNPSPTGIAACQYEGAGFKTVFTTVDFAGLTDGVSPSTKAEFMESVLNWLVGGGCPVTAAPAADTVPPASYTDVALTFDGSVFDTCGSDTVTCYLVFTTNDCDETQVTVPVYMWSARGEVTGDCVINIADVVYLLNYIFVNGPAPNPFCMGDVEVPHDGDVDSNDALYLMSYLFMYGPPPEMPSSPNGALR
jgi:hypothetical protein